MMTFMDYMRNESDVNTIWHKGQVGDVVLVRIELEATSEFELPALFTITEVHPEAKKATYTLSHIPSGKIVSPITGEYLYYVYAYIRLVIEYNEYVIRSLNRELKAQLGFVSLLKSVLVERGIIPIITEDELRKLKALAAKAE